jgi:CDP-diacylglycerol--glycerol-3-phosphate 3-phosphatidyltransferase
MDLYASKAAINARLLPVVDRLAAAGITPDQVTLAAIPVALAGGAALLLSPQASWLLLIVPLLVILRLVLNLVDGNLARRTGRMHPRGELFNEVGDRIADVAFLAPVTVLPGAMPVAVLLGVLVAVLASYVGVAVKAAGGERLYRGVLSKPGRMALLAITCLVAFALGPDDTRAWAAFGPLLLVGTSLTLIERLVIAVRTLP